MGDDAGGGGGGGGVPGAMVPAPRGARPGGGGPPARVLPGAMVPAAMCVHRTSGVWDLTIDTTHTIPLQMDGCCL
jgi:hypothetical protein